MRHLVSAFVLLLVAGLSVAVPLRGGANKGWGDFVDPDKDCKFQLDGDKLTITVPGTDHDLGIERNKMNAPRSWQNVEGDFTIQVKVTGKFEPKDMNNQDRAAYHGAGFVILADDKTYIRLDRATYWRNEYFVYGNFELRQEGKIERFGSPDDLTLDNDKATWLKIERKGNRFFGYVGQAKDEWTSLGDKEIEMPAKLRIGVAAINTSQQTFAPTFSELKIDVEK